MEGHSSRDTLEEEYGYRYGEPSSNSSFSVQSEEEYEEEKEEEDLFAELLGGELCSLPPSLVLHHQLEDACGDYNPYLDSFLTTAADYDLEFDSLPPPTNPLPPFGPQPQQQQQQQYCTTTTTTSKANSNSMPTDTIPPLLPSRPSNLFYPVAFPPPSTAEPQQQQPLPLTPLSLYPPLPAPTTTTTTSTTTTTNNNFVVSHEEGRGGIEAYYINSAKEDKKKDDRIQQVERNIERYHTSGYSFFSSSCKVPARGAEYDRMHFQAFIIAIKFPFLPFAGKGEGRMIGQTEQQVKFQIEHQPMGFVTGVQKEYSPSKLKCAAVKTGWTLPSSLKRAEGVHIRKEKEKRKRKSREKEREKEKERRKKDGSKWEVTATVREGEGVYVGMVFYPPQEKLFDTTHKKVERALLSFRFFPSTMQPDKPTTKKKKTGKEEKEKEKEEKFAYEFSFEITINATRKRGTKAVKEEEGEKQPTTKRQRRRKTGE